ncbi:carboxypeptidase regulatory-like domain-containing protein [Alloacidobacterium dinghuense]|uniref:Carboxypeptidase regulatory-like domain-containing protein n=1 Tax=Alloacidobacterium dinghuense TaxID=2763107 RepID=A0A7G8BDE0_9BACT|nr:carboxypeptidase-like regulatory domain-containing protein [Alloacidobacterium dinghuense]QNI30560.1 carboxypeptidase regulatory-like domain-containing protein [Alloacidobacterium dinghuense]
MTDKLLKSKLLYGTVALFLVLLGLQNRALAQVTYATVHGTVTDSSGAVVPNATVTAINTSTGIKTTVTSDSQGYYTMPQLQIGGPYTVTVHAAGFEDFQTSGLTLHLNDNRDVPAQLQIGAASQTVQVQAAAVQVETADTQLKQVVTSQQIETMPLLGRDASGLQKLQPGSVESSDRFGNYSANGSQTQSNSFLLDGADINDGPLQTEGIAVNPDALAEENIVTSTLNPEFARNSGAIVNQTIKSGANHFHGSAFYFYRDTFLNNGNYFSQTRPPYHQNLYGATIGGPVIKDKLFFFLGYQGYRRRTGSTTLAPVFNTSQIGGDFSGDNNLASSGANNATGLSTNPIPFAINGCPAGTPWNTCFPGGTVQLAQSQYNSISQNLLNKFVPAPNEVRNGVSYYNFNSPNTGAADQGVIRLDYHPTNNDSIWGSSVFQSNPDTRTLSFGGSDLPGFGMNNARHFKLFMASWTHTFSSTTLNELRAGYFRFNYADVEPATVVDPATYGFNIVPNSAQSSLPLISVAGLNNNPLGLSFLGFSNEGPQPRKDTNLSGADNFTKIVGNHSLKFGVSIEQFVVNNPYSANNNGNYTFNGAGPYSSGDPILDFVLGVPDQYAQTSGSAIDARSYEYYAYGQDSWKITNDLTLNYGLAWDVETPNSNHQFGGLGINCWTPGSETSQAFPGGPPGLTFPTDPGCNKAGGPTTRWDHFGPRLGFAWSPSSGPEKLIGPQGSHEFALRGGFGLYYNRDAEEGQLQNLSDPPWLKNSFGAGDFGGSPGFANPFTDVAGNGSEPNPFPYVRPSPGATLNWPNYSGLDISTYPKNYSVPYVYNYNLNIQRAISPTMVMQIGYVGSMGRKLVRAYEGDPITAAGHAACLADATCTAGRARLHQDYPQYFTQPATVPGTTIPWYLSVGQQHTDGASSYNSLQASLTKGPSHGLAFTLAYTFSHGLDNGSGLESSGFNGATVNTFPGFQYLAYGDSDYDARHRFVASYDYEIPIFASWKNNLIAREALSGWHLTGVTALQTGFPVTITNSGTFNSLYCDQYTYYSCPDNVETSTFSVKSLDVRKTGNWFDNSIFSQEPVGAFGNAKRNFFHGPGFNYTNLELAKNFPLGAEGQRYIQLRLESFNAFNHANFSNPDANFTDGAQFGAVQSVVGASTADVNADPQPGRAVQLAAKFYF